MTKELYPAVIGRDPATRRPVFFELLDTGRHFADDTGTITVFLSEQVNLERLAKTLRALADQLLEGAGPSYYLDGAVSISAKADSVDPPKPSA